MSCVKEVFLPKKRVLISLRLSNQLTKAHTVARKWCLLNNRFFYKLLSWFVYILTFPLVFLAFLLESFEIAYSRRRLASLLGCSRKFVAGSRNDLISLGGTARYYAGDLIYDASIADSILSSLEIIWGHADFRAIENTASLQSLRIIGGNAYFPEPGFEELSSLENIGGAIYQNGIECTIEQPSCRRENKDKIISHCRSTLSSFDTGLSGFD